jgi:hypothetical protein
MRHKRIKVGHRYADCDYRPLRCTRSNYSGDDLYGVSVLDGMEYACSPSHCNPRKLNRSRFTALIEAWRRGGQREAMIFMGWTPEAADEFMKNWRK